MTDKPTERLFATATIASIYVQQGKLQEARAIYRQLLQERPDDRTLRDGLRRVEAMIAEQRDERPADGRGGDRVELSRRDGNLHCRWSITDEGQQRAQLVLGGQGQLTLRLVGFPAVNDLPPRDETLDAAGGTLELPRPPGSTLVSAAVGLLDDSGRFASIVHCDLLPVQ